MVEEEGLDRGLEEVDESVVPPHVRELVREERLELRRREPAQRSRRDEERRPQPADDRRDLDESRSSEGESALHAEAFRERAEEEGLPLAQALDSAAERERERPSGEEPR